MKVLSYNVFPLTVMAVAALAFAAPRPARAADSPLFRVGGKDYTLANLAGVTEQQLRQRFRKETEGMTLENLMRFTSDEAKAEAVKVPEAHRRAFVEEQAFLSAQRGLLRYGLDTVIRAAIAESILEDQDVDLKDYVDVDLIRKCVRNQIRYIAKLRKDPDQEERDEPLLEELNRELGINWDKKSWLESRQEARRVHPLQRWQGEFWASPIVEDVSVKSVLASVLVRDAWAKGHYHRQAVELGIIDRSTFEVYEIDGFASDKAVLEGFFRAITTKDGVIREGGLIAFVDGVRKFSPAVQFRPGVIAGWDLISKDDLTVPPLNRLIEVRPHCYRIIGWQKRFDAERMTPDQKEGFEVTTNNYAFRLVAKEYFPEVVIHAPHVPFVRPSVENSLGIEGFLLVGTEMKKGNYVKKAYPAELFDAYREARANLKAFGAKAAVISALKDRKGAQALVEELTVAGQMTVAKKAQDRYREMAAKLAQEFLLDSPSP